MNDVKDKTYTVASLFAGIGGFCRAFERNGFVVKWANEIDGFARETYELNFPNVKLIGKDIRKLSVAADKLEPVDVLTAGFPCQPFSVAGAQKGFNDPRGRLFFEIVRLLKEYGQNQPKIVLLENVKGLINHDKGKTFSVICQELQNAGYWLFKGMWAVLNTSVHTDIPQNRERLYVAAFSVNHFDYVEFRFPEVEENKRDVRSFLALDEKQDEGLYFRKGTKYGDLFYEALEKGSDDSVYLLRRYYVRENKGGEFFTLTANMGDGGHNVPVVKDKWGMRKLTPEECAKLQGFTDIFSFPESMSRTQKYKQVGNSVTVDLVERLARECLYVLNNFQN